VTPHQQVSAVAGRGLEGDRNFFGAGDQHDPADEITLIDAEGVRAAGVEHGVEFAPGEHRRNVEVTGLDLPALVGMTIRVGGVEVEVLEKNPPCKHLAELTGKPVLKILRHQGGVRGRILTTGTIRTGDTVTPPVPTTPTPAP
jgi:MOSC domain-containing protein YiiM